MDRPLSGIGVEIARKVLADIEAITPKKGTVQARIEVMVARLAPTLAMPGCGPLTAAKIVGETASVTRFRSEAGFAQHAGVAPIPAWSGNTAGRVRMSRAGNRQLNAALHRIAVTQIRLTDSLGRAYYDKRLAAGDSRAEALRCLRRRLTREVFRHLHNDQSSHHRTCAPVAA